MRIKKRGAYRTCTEREYLKKFKPLGYVTIEELKEEIDISEYHKGAGWYDYEGETMRKAELLEKLGGESI